MSAVRPAEAADAAAIMSVRHRSWRATYGPLIPDYDWPEPAAAAVERFRDALETGRQLALVTPADGPVLAFSLYGPCRDDDLPGAGEVYAIYADPDHLSTGLGRDLLGATVAELGSGPVVLWVLEANQRARRFYEIAGFVADGSVKDAELPAGVRLPEIRYRRSGPEP